MILPCMNRVHLGYIMEKATCLHQADINIFTCHFEMSWNKHPHLGHSETVGHYVFRYLILLQENQAPFSVKEFYCNYSLPVKEYDLLYSILPLCQNKNSITRKASFIKKLIDRRFQKLDENWRISKFRLFEKAVEKSCSTGELARIIRIFTDNKNLIFSVSYASRQKK